MANHKIENLGELVELLNEGLFTGDPDKRLYVKPTSRIRVTGFSVDGGPTTNTRVADNEEHYTLVDVTLGKDNKIKFHFHIKDIIYIADRRVALLQFPEMEKALDAVVAGYDAKKTFITLERAVKATQRRNEKKAAEEKARAAEQERLATRIETANGELAYGSW